MIPPHVREMVCQLAAQGNLSVREIARRTGASRTWVSKFLRDHGHREKSDRWDADPRKFESAERCEICGHKVFLPCVACQAAEYRRQQERRADPRRASEPDMPPGMTTYSPDILKRR